MTPVRQGAARAIGAAAAVLCIALAGAGSLAAQTGPVVARAASVTGNAVVFTASSGNSFGLSAGFLLNPGDRVDTRSGGRVVIDLSDGSMVVVEPQSVVVLKDFRQAESLRELFEILLGKVRVSINHFGNRPNPYRMNSPTASIAVRGTEFSIEVSPTGDTRVIVYQGSVEVTSLSDPGQSVLVEAGRGVLIQAGRDFHMLAAPGIPFAGRQDQDDRNQRAQANAVYDQTGGYTQTAGASQQAHGDSDGATLRATASAYDNYVAGLSDLAQVPFLDRFNALAEPYLDTLENPAYATQFHAAEGRVFLLPTFGGGLAWNGSNQTYGPAGAQSTDYGLSPQVSAFSPIGNSGFVAGGSLSFTRAGDSALTSTPDEDPVPTGQGSSGVPVSGRTTSNFYSGSVVLARRIGSATSFGVELESLRGNGSLASTSTDTDFTPSVEQISSASRISQTSITAGLSRDLNATTTLGIFYRYGLISATDHDLSHTINGSPATLNSTDSSGHSSEVGLRLRGVITPKLFYGITGSWSGIALGDGLVRTGTANSHEQDRAQNGSVGLGLSYALLRRAILTFDTAAGVSRIAALRLQDSTGLAVQNGTANSRFLSTHVAVQVDLTRRLFVTASYLNVWHAQHLNVNLFADSTGALSMVQDSFFPTTLTAYQLASHFSDFGVGWRFSPNLFVQYLFSTDYGVTTPSHALMLRYTFRFHKAE
ncbi:MAG: FecR family protein [Candidatus Sulfopaludibacter sp.]|nr:FecR family protein [Candidatus Sulfopaludibacter sp.]